jgi:hypothetical protein
VFKDGAHRRGRGRKAAAVACISGGCGERDGAGRGGEVVLPRARPPRARRIG